MGQTSDKEAQASDNLDSSAVFSTEYNSIMIVVRWKYVSLIVLVVQNTALVLTMRYSRTVDGPKYIASTAVVLMELLKLTVSVLMELYRQKGDVMATLGTLWKEILENLEEILKISVPSVLYTIQNNLLYVALSYLDAATFQVSFLH